MNNLQKLWITDPNNTSALVIRVVLGVVIFAHGAQKLLGWFGGHGFAGTMDFFTEQMNLPAALALLVILIESIGSICLILGLGSRLMAFGIICVMLGAIALVHWSQGFFMDWNNTPAGEGFEFHLLAIAAAIAIMIDGGGRWSIDSQFKFKRRIEVKEGRKERVRERELAEV